MAAADEAAAQPAPEPVAEAASPWDEPEAPAFGGETRAIPKLSFDDFQQASAPEAPVESSWDAPAFESAPEAPAFGSDASPFASEADAPAFGGETRAFPKLSFEDFQQMSAPSVPDDPQPEPQAAPSAWEEAPAAEANASPFGDPADSPFSAEPAAFEEELPATAIWSTTPESSVEAEQPEEAPLGLTDQAVPEDMPFAEEPAAESAWSLENSAAAEVAEPEATPEEPAAAASMPPEAPQMPIAARSGSADLSEEQIDRIARRVVELISDQVVRNIAWEVIPDLAEMVVKERIRQLEAEA